MNTSDRDREDDVTLDAVTPPPICQVDFLPHEGTHEPHVSTSENTIIDGRMPPHFAPFIDHQETFVADVQNEGRIEITVITIRDIGIRYYSLSPNPSFKINKDLKITCRLWITAAKVS